MPLKLLICLARCQTIWNKILNRTLTFIASLHADVMNKEEALRCVELSKQQWRQGEKHRALRLAKKSILLFETAEGIAWLETIERSFSSTPVTPNTNSTASSRKQSTTASAVPEREYTAEQVEAVRRVKQNGSDYYSVLGLERNANDAEIKRAYRKMALQFHPDKNAAPGAADAFKLIGEAFSTLSDPNKREVYDRYGIDGMKRHDRRSSDGGDGHNGGAASFTGGFYGAEELTPEDIFNLFFSAQGMHPFSMGSGGRRMRNRGSRGAAEEIFRQQQQQQQQQQRRRRRQQENNDSLSTTLIQFLPLLLLLLWNFLSSAFAEQPLRDPSFATSPLGAMRTERQTYRRQLPYFINPAELKRFIGGDARRLQLFEDRIEMQIIRELQQKCLQESREKQQRINSANFWWWTGEEERKAAEQMETPACDRLRKLS